MEFEICLLKISVELSVGENWTSDILYKILKTLPIELTRTHNNCYYYITKIVLA